MNTAQSQFVEWVRVNQPTLYEATIARVGVGAADQQSWWQSFVGAAKELVPVVVSARSQKRLLDVQMKRAQRGLPPLNTAQIAPTVRVQAGLSPDIKRMLIPVGLAGLGLLLFFMLKKSR